MKNLFKFGFLGLALSLFAVACTSSEQTDGETISSDTTIVADTVVTDTIVTTDTTVVEEVVN